MVSLDMDMPERCAECYFADGIKLRCTAPAGRRLPVGFGFLLKRRPKWCPLSEDTYICPICGKSLADEGGASQ